MMKTLLSILGIVSISASGSSAAVLAKTQPTIVQKTETQSTLKISNFENNDLILQFNNLREDYAALSDHEKEVISIAMEKLPELKTNNEISRYLANSKIDFIKDNQTAIETMYYLSNSIEKISQSSLVSTQMNVDWIGFNQIINLNFGDSNDLSVWYSAYGPSQWWKFWEWGGKADFAEGIINCLRVLKLLSMLPNVKTLESLENILKDGKEVFDYIMNLADHGTDKLIVLYNMLLKVRTSFEASNIPFGSAIFSILDGMINEMKDYTDDYLVFAVPKIIDGIKAVTGKDTLQEVGQEYGGYLNQAILGVGIAKTVVSIINSIVPGFIQIFLWATMLIPNQMIDADQNHKGVYIKFSQFVIPLGFKSR